MCLDFANSCYDTRISSGQAASNEDLIGLSLSLFLKFQTGNVLGMFSVLFQSKGFATASGQTVVFLFGLVSYLVVAKKHQLNDSWRVYERLKANGESKVGAASIALSSVAKTPRTDTVKLETVDKDEKEKEKVFDISA